MLKLLKLLEKDVDYAKTIDSILAGGVLGFYDDEVKELYVGGVGDNLDPATRATLAHELTHALTDQHFDFGTKTKALDDQNKTEEGAAFSALIEGDAELVATLWQQQHLSARERQQAAAGASAEALTAYARAPRYLLESLFFPYTSGLTFVESRHKAGGFAEVDKAYRNPPTSTEHILHPETYASGQTWSPPALPDLAAATGCSAVDTGTLGEFDMIQILSGELNSNDAKSAAAGWNGDAYGAVRCGTALGLADRWQADTANDAGRLADALTRWARGWSGVDPRRRRRRTDHRPHGQRPRGAQWGTDRPRPGRRPGHRRPSRRRRAGPLDRRDALGPPSPHRLGAGHGHVGWWRRRGRRPPGARRTGRP